MNSLERKRLNSYQKEAVLDESPACLVNANVGSGKTTVLTEKVRYLHEERLVPYEKMMVLTFTNKAADEIAERLGIEKSMWGFGTFHSVARQLLCKYLPEKCTVEGTDRAVNQNETTDWNREFEVIEPEEELQMRTDIRSSIRTVCRRGWRMTMKHICRENQRENIRMICSGYFRFLIERNVRRTRCLSQILSVRERNVQRNTEKSWDFGGLL